MQQDLRLLPKIDAHHHLWDVESDRYPWLVSGDPVQRVYGSSAALRVNYRLDDYLRDARHQTIVKSVHVQTGWNPADPVGETRHLQAIADSNPGGFPHAIVGAADLHRPDVEDVLAAHCRYPNMRGIRVSLNWHDNPVYRWADRPDYLRDDQFRRGFRLLARYGLSFECQIYPSQMGDAAALADLSLETPFAILHAGMPVERDPEGLQLWRAGLATLAERPNVAIKFCGLSMLIHDWTPEVMRDYAREIVDIFGPNRIMVASNFPVDRLKGSFDAYYDAYAYAFGDHGREEQSALFHDNAARFYRI
ncbi:amidohydrolase family protein [Chelatococcus sp. GCM10030263]|uniref:amidohydrolase family protein n=1 Tax=Chelatococcus sp. GCM10030263 TaxID=3273387 RepID=UPI003614B9CF